MVLPRDEGDSQRMIRITKQADGTLREECFDQFSFVPMLAGKNSGGNKIV
jgi:protein-L-isoaspartate(D-aspartate) O-methyltransferase